VRAEGFWLVGGRLVDHGAVNDDDVAERTERALGRSGRHGELGAHVPPDEIDEVRLIGSWLASHPDAPQVALRVGDGADPIRPDALREFLLRERELDDDRLDLVGADAHV
jgi:hypothetical protein